MSFSFPTLLLDVAGHFLDVIFQKLKFPFLLSLANSYKDVKYFLSHRLINEHFLHRRIAHERVSYLNLSRAQPSYAFAYSWRNESPCYNNFIY